MAALIVIAAWLFVLLEVFPVTGLAHGPVARFVCEVRGWVRSK